MKKITPVLLLLCFGSVFAEDSIEEQMLDAQIEKLTMERDEKYKALEKCAKESKTYKIAGIATLTATGIGLYANIKLHEKMSKMSGGSGGGDANRAAPPSTEDNLKDVCAEMGNPSPECDGI
jgi:hypothetical protein